jgi:hypothetical protein
VRLQLRGSVRCTAGLALLVIAGGNARGADQVTIRGAYYREPSTRVIQPVVEIQKDLPHGFDLDAHYLVDAITSASAAAGTGKDTIFTETRNQVGLAVGKNWDRTRATLAYRYSAESDYWSHGVGGSLSQRAWGDTATLALSLGTSLDSMSSRGRTPACAGSGTSCSLSSYFLGLSYAQVLSPVAVAQISAETAFLDGFQGNLYRSVPNFGYEVPPNRRERNAVGVGLAYYFPASSTGLQLRYRYYWDFYPGTSEVRYDPWKLRAQTIEGRVYQRLTRNLEARVLYRYHIQNQAAFWCDVTANADCYQMMASPVPYQSSDPKLGPVRTHYPEVKLVWEAESLQVVPFFRWFAAGAFEISYGYYMQNDSFGNAHVLQAGYTMPY